MSTYLTDKERFDRKPFQLEDLSKIVKLDKSANWSDMGAYKTSTVLWWLEEKLKHIEAPKILIVTTRSGKGTYWKLTPIVQPEWELYNLSRKRITLVIDDTELPMDTPLSELYGNVPMLFVAHYDVFTKRKPRKKKSEEEIEDDLFLGSSDELEELIAKDSGVNPQGNLDDILKTEWDAVILDEAHRIKNRGVGWTKNIKKLKATYKHVMTGTGFINRPDEIWSLFHFLHPRVYTSYWRFRETFCEEEIDYVTGFRKVVGIRSDAESEFKELVRSVGPRRTKREVFKNLPEPIFSPIEVELNITQRRMYEAIRDDLFAMDQQGVPLIAPSVLAALQRQRQICVATPLVVRDYYDEEKERRRQEIKLVEPSSKLDALMEIIEGLEWDDERRDQVVVFSNFKDPIELAKKRFDPQYDKNGKLRRAGISYIHMEESDSDAKRYEKWKVEFPKKEHQVFICTLQLGSESIDLTPATTCVFLDRSWSPLHNEQGV